MSDNKAPSNSRKLKAYCGLNDKWYYVKAAGESNLGGQVHAITVINALASSCD